LPQFVILFAVVVDVVFLMQAIEAIALKKIMFILMVELGQIPEAEQKSTSSFLQNKLI
jgi:DNA phosphorothioation-dependent restriction protein DptG